jgi:hypothetical protein
MPVVDALRLVHPAGPAAGSGDVAFVSRHEHDAAVATAAALDPDGLLVVERPSRTLRADLADTGFAPAVRLVHLPDVERSRYVFPAQGPARRYAVRDLAVLRRSRRLAARGLPKGAFARLAPTTVVFRRRASHPLFAWLSALPREVGSASALVAPSWRPEGATVVFRFAGSAAPDAVVKIGGGAEREWDALALLGDGARAASARVPEVLDRVRVGDVTVLVETPVGGVPATRLALGAPRRARRLVRTLARWLDAWNRNSLARRALDREDLERLVLTPARQLLPEVPAGPEHLVRLERLADACVEREIGLVAAHNDLTAANVLVDGRAAPAVVDWEEAEPQALPLGDLVYMVADFFAAVDGYRDRVQAFQEASALTRELVDAAAQAHGLDEAAVELCVSACWLRHAANERRERGGDGATARPFLGILARVAEEGAYA